MTEIPPLLIENIKNKNAVLFLGSGFCYNATNSKNSSQPPTGNQLATLISDEFLNGEFKDSPLTYVSDIAISESSLFEVQNFISEQFEPYEPSKEHLLYSDLPWKAIFTTNYDLILEKAYQTNKSENIQNFVKVIRNTPEPQIFNKPNTVPYYKLHGCISHINDPDLPLILSTEQYISHLNNRDRLFNKLEELSLDYPFLFIGYSNQDYNVRAILKKLENIKDGRPRSYMVGPNFTEAEIRYWQERKITPVALGHEEFITQVNDKISKNERSLSKLITNTEKSIYKKFKVSTDELVPSESLKDFLDYEIDFIHPNFKIGNSNPKAFYKGFLNDFDPIINNWDVRRNLEDRVLSDVILDDLYQNESDSYLFLIKGYAGSGKSVFLKRLAWETATEFEKFSIFIKTNQPLRVEPIIELYNYVKDRIYIFIDNAIENQYSIIDLINKARYENIPITIIATERINVLNEQEEIIKYINQDYKLIYLNDNEILDLITLLEKNDSLGHLNGKSLEDQKFELQDRAGRVLLVALYEATGGRPFEDIVLNEYEKISSEDAKSLYLTVSVFHRLGTKVRAGLISRIHKISFKHFSDKLFKPLEFIVFAEKDYFINDYLYSTRHQFIAQMLFEQILKNEQDRYDEYIRILRSLDIDYSSDWSAFLDITNAKKLNEVFNDPIRVNNIYDLAEEICPDNAKLIQQRGIYEMISRSGRLYSSQKLLKKANELLPKDPVISHSLAEVSLKKAEQTENKIERNKYLNESEKLCKQIIKSQKDHSYSYHTLLKIELLRFEDAIENDTAASVERKMKEFEKLANEAKQYFPGHEFILETEAKFNEVIDNEPKAIDLLKYAFEANQGSPYLAIRYAKLLEKNDQLDDAIEALSASLKLNPNDRDVNYHLATLKRAMLPTDFDSYKYLYRRAFTKGDTRYEA